MGSWFGGVPSAVRVCGVDLVGAEEALAKQEPRDPTDVLLGDHSSDDDWGAVALFKLARLQLDEMTHIIEQIVGGSITDLAVNDVEERLKARAEGMLRE